MEILALEYGAFKNLILSTSSSYCAMLPPEVPADGLLVMALLASAPGRATMHVCASCVLHTSGRHCSRGLFSVMALGVVILFI